MIGSSSYWDDLLNQIALALAKWSLEVAGSAVMALLHAFGGSTEPNFATLAPSYDRMLAIGLLLTGSFIALALIENLLGGTRGAGWNVVPRTLVACTLAFVGWGIVQYLAGYSNLLASTWTNDFLGQNHLLAAKVTELYSTNALRAPALGSIGGLILTALLTLTLALLVYVELILRAALILVTTTFIPFVCVMAIWPRMVGAAVHMAEFLIAVLLSKFVIATAIYVGYSLIVQGFMTSSTESSANGMVVGLAALAIAAFAPVILLQGLSFGQVAAAPLVRSWSSSGAGLGRSAVSRAAGSARSLAGKVRGQVARRIPSLGRSQADPEAEKGNVL